MSAHLVSPELVGRSAELGHLAGAFDHAPATVPLGGEAGVGKSRLVNDFTARLDATVLLGGCVELDGPPFAPFVAALRGVGVTDRERADLAPLLPSGEATGDEARPRLFEGVLSLPAGLSEQRPVVLVVEDAHWLDRSSRDLLDFLVRNQRAAVVGGRRVSHEILGAVHDVTPMRSVVDGGVMVVDGDGYAFR